MYMPTKKIFKIKGYKIMLKGSNCDRKSQFSEILTEPIKLLNKLVATCMYRKSVTRPQLQKRSPRNLVLLFRFL